VLDREVNADSEEGRAAEFYELQAKFNNEMWTSDVFVIMAANTNLRNIASDDSNGSFWNVCATNKHRPHITPAGTVTSGWVRPSGPCP